MESKNLGDLYELPLMDWRSISARLDGGVDRLPEFAKLRRAKYHDHRTLDRGRGLTGAVGAGQ